MQMLFTTLGFFAVTALCVYVYLRRTVAAPAAAGGMPVGAPCPRCQAPVPQGSEFCPGCGVPQQVYEVVGAAEVPADAPDKGGDEPEHAVVRADLCVGCGTCVAACPEEGALRVENKLAIVDLGLCVGHGTCAEACPVNAIILTAGEAVQRVEVPEVKPTFESNVPGVYIVGELGGRGLIKNAINEGKIAIEAIRREFAEQESAAPEGALDLVIVGSGPAGLSAAMEAARSKLKYVVLEQGTLADTIRKYPRRKLLLGEPVKVPLYGDLWVADTTKETLLSVWESIIENSGIDVRTHHRVDSVERDGDLFAVNAGGENFKARRVVLAMGRRGTPRRLGVPGEEGDNVFYDIVEMEPFKGRRVVVVGGGDSALESAVGLSEQPGTQVVLSYRGAEFARAKERNRAKLEQAAGAGKLEVLLQSQLREIRPDAVVIDVGGKVAERPNDDVIVRIGGVPPFKLLDSVGIRRVKKDVPIPDGGEAANG